VFPIEKRERRLELRQFFAFIVFSIGLGLSRNYFYSSVNFS
jgi:hypothetical protein